MDPNDLASYKIATLNINNITNDTKIQSLNSFLRVHELDIVLLQEVENDSLDFPGYNCIFNINESKRGTAILLKSHIVYSHVTKSLDSRVTSVRIHDRVTVCNIYAPSGSQNYASRESFFNTTVMQVVRDAADYLILGGDFNSIVRSQDATGNTSLSPNTNRIMNSLSLKDAWLELNRNRMDYSFVRGHSASRIDRILVKSEMVGWLRTASHAVNSFSDHKACIVRMVLPNLGTPNGRGMWSMQANVLDDEAVLQELAIKWLYWTRQRRNYNSWMNWWLEFAKPKIRSFLKWKTSLLYKDHRDTMELFYGQLHRAYEAYLNDPSQLPVINRIKARMLSLQREFSANKSRQRETFLQGESTSIFQASEIHTKRTSTRIEKLVIDGNVVRDRERIDQHVRSFFEQLYTSNGTSPSQQFLPERCIPPGVAQNEDAMNDATEDEIWKAIRCSANRKSPGEDGLPKEFYLKTWNVIKREFTLVINEAIRGDLHKSFMDGVIVLVRKKGGDGSIKAFRPITLLNFDYKTFSRILKTRIEPLLPTVLSLHQKCSNKPRNIFEATVSIHDKICQLKHSRRSAALVAFDLDHAFDRVEPSFLLRTMRYMNFNGRLIDLLSKVMELSQSRVLINGRLSTPIDIQRSVRQGDPISMLLFVVSVQPLLDKLDAEQVSSQMQAYADDLSMFVETEADLQRTIDAFRIYGDESGAVLNLQKTTSVDIGNIGWTGNIQWLRKEEGVKILGIIFQKEPKGMIETNWSRTCQIFQRSLWMHKPRCLNLIQKIVLVNTYISSKIWYTASTISIPNKYVARIKTEIGKFLWSRSPQRVSFANLTLPKNRGGLNLHAPDLKAKALLINRLLQLRGHVPCFDELTTSPEMPPACFPHLRTAKQGIESLPNNLLQHPTAASIYHHFIGALPDPQIADSPRNWRIIFKRIHTPKIPSADRSSWYLAVHKKFNHNELLHRQGRKASPNCDYCPNVVEDLNHTLFDCASTRPIWRNLQHQLRTINHTLASKDTNYFLYPEFPGLRRIEKEQVAIKVSRYMSFILNVDPQSRSIQELEYYLQDCNL